MFMILKKIAIALLLTYCYTPLSAHISLRDQLNQCPKLVEFYNSLATEEKTEADQLVTELDQIFNNALSDFSQALEAHPALLEKFSKDIDGKRCPGRLSLSYSLFDEQQCTMCDDCIE
jgi:hypothetical protein